MAHEGAGHTARLYHVCVGCLLCTVLRQGVLTSYLHMLSLFSNFSSRRVVLSVGSGGDK